MQDKGWSGVSIFTYLSKVTSLDGSAATTTFGAVASLLQNGFVRVQLMATDAAD